tara:strand:- start:6311 stop:7270 length:960 start_codon:yes stop_codon:yes gene_type:complete
MFLIEKLNTKAIKSLISRYSTRINKYKIFNNYSLLYFIEGKYHLPFATNIHQILLGVLFVRRKRFNFYFKGNLHVKKFSIVQKRIDNLFRFIKKKYRFYYFDRVDTNFYQRKDFLHNDENDFPINSEDRNFYYKNIHSVAKNELFHKLKFYKDINISKETLVIHLRSGDIFYDDWHSLYVQNPLGYYLKISQKYKKILILTEHVENNFLLKELEKKIDFEIISGSLENDANILLNAPNLATSGVSAFPIACALLSQKLENLIVSNIYLNEHLNPKMINKDFVDVESYEIKNYIDIGEFKKNDTNLEKLLSWDTENITKI